MRITCPPDGQQVRRLVNRRELAELLGVCERTITNMRADGILPHYRVRGGVRYDPAEILAVMRQAADASGEVAR